jgi:predicted Fe-Mo cluster-binding NifX family protein
MKTAFTVWNDRIAPLFDVAGEIHVVESEAGNIMAQSRVSLDDPMPALKIRRLADMGVQMLVCGAISRSAQSMVTAYGIELAAFVNGDLDTVIDAWLCDELFADVLRMPGCNSRFQRGRPSSNSITKEFKMRNNQQGGRYQNRDGKGRGGKGAGGQGCGGKGVGGQGRGGKGAGRQGRGRQYGGQNQSNATMGFCICGKCGHQEPHQQGMPCIEQRCPNCGETMTRK